LETISIGGLQSLGISPEFLALQREFPSIELPQQQAKDFLSRVQDAPEGAAKHFLSARSIQWAAAGIVP